MAIKQLSDYPNDYSDSDPTQYANYRGGPAEAYCEYPAPFDSGLDEVRGSETATWTWPVPIMLAGLVLVTAFLLVFLISTMVKFNDPVGPAPSVVVTNPVTTVNPDNKTSENKTSENNERRGAAQTTAVAPTGATQPPVTTSRSPQPAPATVTVTTTRSPQPAPATMTNPLEPEPAPATMTNPLEPAAVGSSGSEN